MAEPGRRYAPLSDLLAELRARGVAVGIREHYEVAYLLERWRDLSTLKTALGAILGTDREEARIVRETFDELYPGDWRDLDELKRVLVPVLATRPEEQERIAAALEQMHRDEKPLPETPVRRPPSRFGRLLRRYWPGLFVALVLLGVFGFFVRPEPPPEVVTPDEAAIEPPDRSVDRDAVEPPPPPQLDDFFEDLPTPPPLPNWPRGAAAGGLLGLAAFAWLYWVRTGREARRAGYRQLARRADALEGQQTWELDLSGLAPPFDGGLLDDVAMLLSRQASVAEARREIDVDRSVELTLEAGLAPRLAFEKRSSAEPLLVLEDVSIEMRPYRLSTTALLQGLRDRGVYLEHWQFDGDAERLFQPGGGGFIELERLVRQRGASPLLILSTGQGILSPRDFRPAEWIGRLHYWLSRAWLHPNPDPTGWRRAVRELPLPVWPLDAEGLRASSRHLATGESDATVTELRLMHPPRPATPLQINRLRRLLDLAPQRDAGVAELLRQRFCPHVPPAAVAEAVGAPPLEHPPALGPSDDEVRTFLLEVMARSRPPEGSPAEARWRLDRALVAIYLESERESALRELELLAAGPLAAEVAVAVEPLSGDPSDRTLPEALRTALGKRVLGPIGARAERQGRERLEERARRQWSLPKPREVLIPLVLFGLVTALTPYLGRPFQLSASEPIEAFELSILSGGDRLRGPFELQLESLVDVSPPPGPLDRIARLFGYRGFRWGSSSPESTAIERLFDRLVGARLIGRDETAELELRIYAEDRAVEPWRIPTEPSKRFTEESRGHWYWVGGFLPSGDYGVSQSVWVPAADVEPFQASFSDAATGEDLGAVPYRLTQGERTLRGRGGESLALTDGDWILTVEAEGYLAHEQVVRSGERITIELDPEEPPEQEQLLSATLRITGWPEGTSTRRLAVNGEQWDGTDSLVLAPGRVTLEFNGGKEHSWQRTLELPEGETTLFELGRDGPYPVPPDASQQTETASDGARQVIDFEGLESGTLPEQIFTSDGTGPIRLEAANDEGYGPEVARIIDSSRPPARGFGTPNEDFGGPGVGAAGSRGVEYQNNSPEGKVLAFGIGEVDRGDGKVSKGASSFPPATIRFDFSGAAPVTVYSLGLLNLWFSRPASVVELLDGEGSVLRRFELTPTGANGTVQLGLGPTEGVFTMVLRAREQGAITNLVVGAGPASAPAAKR